MRNGVEKKSKGANREVNRWMHHRAIQFCYSRFVARAKVVLQKRWKETVQKILSSLFVVTA